jgi:hypothetical protein
VKFAVWILLCTVLLQLAPAQTPSPAQTPAHAKPFSADMEENATDLAGNMRDIQGKIYVSRPLLRMDMQQPGRPLIILVVNGTTKTTDMLYPDQHKYMEIKADPKTSTGHGNAAAAEIATLRSNPCDEWKDTTCKNIGTEQVNGRACEHWQIIGKNGKVISNVWLDKSLGIAIKTVSERGSRQLTNIKEGEQPASLFKIPNGYSKMDLGQMTQGRQRQ